MDKSLFSRSYEDARDSGINLLQKHEVMSVDFESKIITANNLIEDRKVNYQYDNLVIATGASPIIPDIKGINSPNVYTITKPYMAKDLKENLKNYKNIAIVGGGFIGVEIAEQLAHHGDLDISLYHSRNQLLNNVYDEKAGEAIREELEKLHIDIHFSERLVDLKVEEGLVKEIVTTSRKDKVDALILAIGFLPNTGIFKDKNLQKLRNGAIVIDKFGRSSIKDVWSVGDCATVPHKFLGNVHIPLGTSANKIGREIGINLFLGEDELIAPYESLGSSLVKVGELEFGATGLTEAQAKDLSLDYAIAESQMRNKPSYMPESYPIYFRIIYERESYKILGARVYGKKDAVLRLLPFTTAIHAGLTTRDLAYYDYAYSPPFNPVWEPVNIAASVAK